MRALMGVLLVVAVGSAVWIISLPNMAECRASGRVVDPTERHCEAGATFVQLQEHAIFHATQVVILAAVAGAATYAIYRLVRRWVPARHA
jgi:hypothetical protein